MEFLRSEKAVSEVVSHVFILSLTIIGVAAITLFGVPSIYRMEDMADIRAVEQAFAALDSRVSSVIIGDSPMKTVNINLGGGSLVVEPNASGSRSYIAIKSLNNTFNITIPLGKVEYRLGDRIVAFEGGGLWSKYPSGGSVMLSPPEFHYDGNTLTLSIPTINGKADVEGKGTVAVTFRKNSTMVLFPNTTIDKNRTNPLDYNISGKVYVNITSDFYDAWADYAKSLIYTNVSTDPANRTTSIELKVVPSVLGGSNVIPNPINIRGLPSDDTPLDNFSFRLYDRNGNFNSFDWDIRAKKGNGELIYYIKKTDLIVAYQDNGYSSPVEIWGEASFTVQPGGYIDVDLLNKSLNLTYGGQTPLGSNNGNSCAIDKIRGTFSPTDFSWDNIIINTINANKRQSLYNITQHYFWEMGQLGDMSFCQSQSGINGPQPESTLILGYNATGTLRFLQISEYNVDADIK